MVIRCGVAVVLLLAAACGGSVDSGSEVTAAASTSVTVTYDDGAGAAVQTWQLTCDPTGGDHPTAEAACGVLAGSGVEAVADPPADQVCTMIFGGPQKATVRGTVEGRAVEASLDRADGCGVARWTALAGLLPAVTGP